MARWPLAAVVRRPTAARAFLSRPEVRRLWIIREGQRVGLEVVVAMNEVVDHAVALGTLRLCPSSRRAASAAPTGSAASHRGAARLRPGQPATRAPAGERAPDRACPGSRSCPSMSGRPFPCALLAVRLTGVTHLPAREASTASSRPPRGRRRHRNASRRRTGWRQRWRSSCSSGSGAPGGSSRSRCSSSAGEGCVLSPVAAESPSARVASRRSSGTTGQRVRARHLR